MLRNVSYNRKDIVKEIDHKVGKEFSFMQRMKMGGNGSQRFIMVESSDEIDRLNQFDNKTNYCNIEVRERGIILRFHSRLETYAWAVSYDELEIIKDNMSVSLKSQFGFVKLHPANNLPINNKFFDKLFRQKEQFESKYNQLG